MCVCRHLTFQSNKTKLAKSRSGVLSKKLIAPQSRNSLHFVERDGSTPCAQSPVLTWTPMSPAHILPSHFFKAHFNILPSTYSSSKWPLSFRFITKLSNTFLFMPIRAPRSAYIILRDINFVTYLSSFP